MGPDGREVTLGVLGCEPGDAAPTPAADSDGAYQVLQRKSPAGQAPPYRNLFILDALADQPPNGLADQPREVTRKVLRTVKKVCAGSEDRGLNMVGMMLLVPIAQAWRE